MISHPGCHVLDEFHRDETRRAWLLGSTFSGLGYGIVSVLFSMCFHLLKKNLGPTQPNPRQTRALLGYLTFMYTLSTAAFVFDILATLRGVIGRNCPSDDEIPVDPYFGKADFCYAFLNWGADGLLAWRCYVIFSSTQLSPWIYMTVPALLVTASAGIGVPMIVLDARARTPTVDLMLQIWGAITATINIVLTSMIVIRILVHRRQITRLLGPGHGTQYTSVITMLVESAALVVVFDMYFLVAFALSWPYGNIAFQTWIQTQSIAPFLIIFRVAQGKAWAKETQMRSEATAVQFVQDIAIREAENGGPLVFARSAVDGDKTEGQISYSGQDVERNADIMQTQEKSTPVAEEIHSEDTH